MFLLLLHIYSPFVPRRCNVVHHSITVSLNEHKLNHTNVWTTSIMNLFHMKNIYMRTTNVIFYLILWNEIDHKCGLPDIIVRHILTPFLSARKDIRTNQHNIYCSQSRCNTTGGNCPLQGRYWTKIIVGPPAYLLNMNGLPTCVVVHIIATHFALTVLAVLKCLKQLQSIPMTDLNCA